ncbi:fimbrial protein [Klebsiella oxytoca]|uniref:fimbrial protein n=1 Tax=Klebsiella oxytoca TaxID=571 RepID=UPI0022458AEB|nr:fimbrial protein [Klebsiella oxytoca]MCW9445974.1 fimbrial protein [Klebsiella oxytoca]
MSNNINKSLSFFCICSVLICNSAYAAMTSTPSLTVNVRGSILKSACDINNGKDIEVKFGNVNINDVPNGGISQDILYTLSCPTIGDNVKFSFVGESFSGNTSYLKTSIPNLGIKITVHDGGGTSILSPGGFYNFTYSTSIPQLKATLVGTPSVTGDFNANATLLITYQ